MKIILALLQRVLLALASRRAAWALLHLGVSLPVAAGSISLQLPLACEPGVSCHVQNHFDHDAGPGFRDYACGELGYDGHDGVDLRLPNQARMREGVAVLAAAPGVVRAIRDEMPDISIRETGLDAVKGREAGNGVVIRHEGGWETQYSHLRRGSVRVRPGESVTAGQPLGLVGLSGKTEFPHLHFSVRFQGRPVDPFVGLDRSRQCGVGSEPLWDEPTLKMLGYQPTGLLQAGFASQPPTLKAVEQGQLAGIEIARDSPALLFWVELFGARAGDHGTLELYGPDGRLLANKVDDFARNKARWFSYAGSKRKQPVWPAGEYRGRYRLLREHAGQPPSVVVDMERRIVVR
jgi:hypothetical protein